MTMPNIASPPSRSTFTNRWATTSAIPIAAPTSAAVLRSVSLATTKNRRPVATSTMIGTLLRRSLSTSYAACPSAVCCATIFAARAG